jgi:dihydrofolate reductase
MTMISLVAAMSKNRVIGVNNKLPWHIPEELQHFKKITLHKPIIMGSKTFESLGRKLLPGRSTIVLTRQQDLQGDGFKVAHSTTEALAAAGYVPEVMVIGGAKVFQEFLPLAQRIYLSVIPQEYTGDAFFPELDSDRWRLVDTEQYPKFSVNIYEEQRNE